MIVGIKDSRGRIIHTSSGGATGTKDAVIEAVHKGVDLKGADLARVDLAGADLSRAKLSSSNLCGANLSGSNLSGANLSMVNLSAATMRDTNLEFANLFEANMSRAILNNARMSRSVMYRANLEDAEMSFADLRNAELSGARLPKSKEAELSILPDEGDITGWKQACGGIIVKLLIPADAQRSNATGRKCRASKAFVLAVYSGRGSRDQVDEARSFHDPSFIYRRGEWVKPRTGFDADRWIECAPGIHFYITRAEAENP